MKFFFCAVVVASTEKRSICAYFARINFFIISSKATASKLRICMKRHDKVVVTSCAIIKTCDLKTTPQREMRKNCLAATKPAKARGNAENRLPMTIFSIYGNRKTDDRPCATMFQFRSNNVKLKYSVYVFIRFRLFVDVCKAFRFRCN